MTRLGWSRVMTGAIVFLLTGIPAGIAADASPEMDEDIQIWTVSSNLKEGGGYKSNLLLSDLNRESSLFTATQLDLFAYRSPILDPWEVIWLASGEDWRFWESDAVDKEQLALTSIDVKREIGKRWKLGLGGLYLYSDQVFDASVQEGQPFRIRAKFHKFSVAPTARLELAEKRRVEFRLGGPRNLFDAPLSDYWQGEARVLFGQGFGKASDVTVSSEGRVRRYNGRRHPNPARVDDVEYIQHEVEARLRHYWDEEKRWNSRFRASSEISVDNGDGYFDYWKHRLGHDLAYATERFEARLESSVLRYDYSRQNLPSGEARNRTELVLGLRVEYAALKWLKVFAQAEQEWLFANDPLERYRVTTVWAGLDWSLQR